MSPVESKRNATRVRRRVLRFIRLLGIREERLLLILAVLIGLGTGAGAWLFAKLMGITAKLYYYHLGGSLHVLEGWTLLLLPLLPASGGLLVGCITHYFAREAKGHGVPEVMDAIARKGGQIRPRVSLAKAVASAMTLGSGGSAGTEGPIVQIGAALGSSAGQVFKVPRRQMAVLVGCGAAAGISAIFNAPIAGVLFALEIFLYDFSFRTFTPVVLSSVMSATMFHALERKDLAMLAVDFRYQFQWWEVGNYVLLGLLAGLVAVSYIRTLYFTEDLFDVRLKRLHPILRPVLGGLLLGLLGIWLLLAFKGYGRMDDGQPVAFGNGYPFIHLLLDPGQYELAKLTLWMLVAVLVAKLAATCLTLGSGGSGGVFAPALYMGAALGGLFGLLLRQMGLDVNPAAYAIVGMAAVFAGSTHATLTAIVMLFEMTHDYKVVLPVMLAATIATVFSQRMKRESIYTEKLARRGVRMGTVADLTLLRGISVEDLTLADPVTVHEDDPLSVLISRAGATPSADFVVTDHEEHYRGMVVAEDLRVALLEREAVPLLLVAELLRADIPTVHPHESLAGVHDKFSRHEVSALPVTDLDDPEKIVGLVTRSAMMRRYQQALSAGHGYGDRPG